MKDFIGSYWGWFLFFGFAFLMFRTSKAVKEDEKQRQLKKDEESKKLWERIQLYEKNPVLRYRDMISTEEYKIKFDQIILEPEWKSIVEKLSNDKHSSELLGLAMKIRSQEPDIQKR